ncbi:MAG: hypothetical protein MUE92_00195 [Chloroflexi bacterium]|jgi:hypothetical protein|nr:hypothetical protein [Chloroflexota bacterium]
MATTDSRTGFRLPWSTDRAASREASADPADELVAPAPASDTDAAVTLSPEAGDTIDQGAAGDGVREQEEALVTTLAPESAQHAATFAPPAPEIAAASEAGGGDNIAPAPVASPGISEPAAAQARRPTKFLADLTRAMQAAAEQARSATLEQYRAEGTTVIEQIHARSATGATELRRHADDDVSAIKDWSKAEIARIREETERRVASRREQLEGQLERHAAIIEHEIEKVRGRISTFEGEMGTFFDDLLREEDPAVFAARAASLPEPPSFENLDDDAIAALLQEPGVGVPEPAEAAVAEPAEVEPAAEPAFEAVVAEPAGVEPAADAETAALVEAPAEALVEADANVDTAVEAAVDMATEAEVEVDATAVDETPLDREAAMAAIQAAAEAADSHETETPADPAEDPADVAGAAEPEPEAQADAATPPTESETPEPGLDPRLAMLGLTPDFAAAEMAAAEAAAAMADDEEVPEIGGDALEMRLAGLVPGEAPAPTTETVTTQVIVTGLVSVASIASFKRHLGRLAGVAHVGVSSGPDGEFLFAVQHEQGSSLRDLIPTLPGFGARVVGASDGVVHVSAQDPQD